MESALRRLIAQRELHANLERLTAAGATVSYRACDVRDREGLSALVHETYATYGRIDGVIHGAGLIEDKLIVDKHPDSFDRVVDTKLSSAVVLASCLQAETLRWFVLFSSVSARFGNRGQVDYAAANEGLNKLAQYLDERWPGRVVAINWGPWESPGGMVSAALRDLFSARGVALIPFDTGCRMLLDELGRGEVRDPEVIVAAGAPAGQVAPVLPLLASARCVRGAGGRIEAVRQFDPEQDVFLQDHRIDGQPVLPFAMALELMAEVAAWGSPDLHVTDVSDMRVLRGIQVPAGGQAVHVTAVPRPSAADTTGRQVLDTTITLDGDVAERARYTATIHLAPAPDAGLAVGLEPLAAAGRMPFSVADAYREWLFHGPRFQHVTDVEVMAPDGARSWLRGSSPAESIAGAPAGEWLIDPVIVDCALQVNVLWARQHWDLTLLPSGLHRLRRFASLRRDGPIRHELRIDAATRAPIVVADHYLYAPDGRLLAVLHGMEGVGAKALNRLAGSARD